ncbi:MAG: hemolysin III family protein [Patescibacteria group bacterium]|nr:hemolysin III family protein [Patescibacteria group bacterium]
MLFSKDNEPLSALTHFLGLLLSIAGLVLMVVFASLKDKHVELVGLSIFGSSLILAYSASFIYHIFSKEHKVKKTLQKIDHAMIFVLIAGTYTPVCISMPNKGLGWSIFGIIWGLAILGIIIKTVGIKIPGWLSTIIYLAIGWFITIAIVPIIKWLGLNAVLWLIAGGLAYSLGTIFFALENYVKRNRWWGMHEIFHLFVMLGSFCHFWLMFHYLIK